MVAERPVLATARRFTGWYIFAAVLFIVAGLFAIIEPATAVVAITLMLGWLLIFGAVAHLIGTFRGGGAQRVLFQIFSAIVFAIGGIYILTHPLLAISTLTVLLAVVIFLVGLFDIIGYFRIQSENRSGWMLVNGIAALILGALIWVHWPSSSAWAIGTLVGVNLLLTGITRLMIGVSGRRLIKDVTA